MSFLKELFNSMARVIGRIIAYLLIGFLLFYFFNNRVEAQSYYFDQPRNHRLCEGPFNNTIACNNANSTIVNSASPGLQKGNYIIATYRADLNINGVSGTSFEAGRYSVEFSGYFTTIQNTDIDTKVIKVKLLYYPNSSNEYAVATCDNSEAFRVTKTKTDEDYNFYYYSYTCETLQVTSGKTFLGYQVYVDTSALVDYIDYSVITKNLTLIGEGDATNNDVINNANQNTQDIINNQNQNQNQTNQGLQDIEDAILDTTQPNLDNFNYTDSTGGLISTFLTMPITLLRVMNNVESCRAVALGELFGVPLSLDCINPGVFLGETLWNIIDYFIVFTMITSIAQLFIYVYEKFKNLDDFFNEFYTPQHMKPDEYIPRHGGGK